MGRSTSVLERARRRAHVHHHCRLSQESKALINDELLLLLLKSETVVLLLMLKSRCVPYQYGGGYIRARAHPLMVLYVPKQTTKVWQKNILYTDPISSSKSCPLYFLNWWTREILTSLPTVHIRKSHFSYFNHTHIMMYNTVGLYSTVSIVIVKDFFYFYYL